MKENLNDIYFTTHFTTVGDDPVVSKFIEDFKAKYDGATPGAFHALGYDEMYFLVFRNRLMHHTEPKHS